MRIHEIQHTKASHTYSILKDVIRRLEIKTGAHLEVEVIARIFKSSVTPIREALSRLACESLIEMQPNRGYFIRRVDLAEQISLHEVGDLILTHACGHIDYWPINFPKGEISPEYYCGLLEEIVTCAGNPEMNQMFLNVIDRTFGMITLHLQRDEVRAIISHEISGFLDAKNSSLSFEFLRRIRERFRQELPRLVRDSAVRPGRSITQLASTLSRS